MTATTDDTPTSIKTWTEVGEDCRLTLDVAPGYYEVVLVRTVRKPPTIHPSWPAGYWQRLGTTDDPSFVRPPQPTASDASPPEVE